MKPFNSSKSNSCSKKIAILVPNPCNPDFRVIKHAELFAKNGHEVRIYCRWTYGLPKNETVNGVMYIRKPITIGGVVIDIISKLNFWRTFKKNHSLTKQNLDRG